MKDRLSVVLDAGHGADDHGGEANGIRESEWVHDFALSMYWLLHRDEAIIPRIVRSDDENPTLEHAAIVAEACSADLVINIHVNVSDSPEVSGLMAFYMPSDRIGNIVADAMQVAAPTGLRRRSSKATLAVPNSWPRVFNVMAPFRKRDIPSVLIECGFASSKKDSEILKSTYGKHAIMETVLAGIDSLVMEHNG